MTSHWVDRSIVSLRTSISYDRRGPCMDFTSTRPSVKSLPPLGRRMYCRTKHQTQESATLLGAPFGPGPAMYAIQTSRCEDLTPAVSRLQLIPSHDALVLLKNSLSIHRLQYVLRTAYCCWGHHELQVFDGHLRTALGKVCNIALDDEQLLQASLPVGRGGLGIRRASSLALSAFLASAAGTQNLQACILINCTVTLIEPLFVSASQQWMAITNLPCPSDHRQRL